MAKYKKSSDLNGFKNAKSFSFSKTSPLSSWHCYWNLWHFLTVLWDKYYYTCILQIGNKGTEKFSGICGIIQQSWDSNPVTNQVTILLSTRSLYCFPKVEGKTVTNLLSCPSGPLIQQRMILMAAFVSQSALPRPLASKWGEKVQIPGCYPQNMIQNLRNLHFNKHPQKILQFINVWEPLALKEWNKEK